MFEEIMIKIILLKNYKESIKGNIIKVKKEEAEELIENGIARYCVSRDFLVKAEFGKSKALMYQN